MPHETDEVNEIRRWPNKARNDWQAAQHIMRAGGVETDVAAFHCQQAVEKLFKAFLVSERIAFEKIHDLRLLLNQYSSCDEAFESLRDAAEPLTLYAVAYRYPGPAEPSAAEVERALRAVQTVWTFVTLRLPREAADNLET